MNNDQNLKMDGEKSSTGSEPTLEKLWQFAGQSLRSSDFTGAMVHFYRGEVSRSNAWRVRLDATTNWAVITTGAALTFAFGEVHHSPSVLLITTLLLLLFLFIEARRYRYYELWTYRVRIMETNFFTALLSPPFLPGTDWAEKIAESLNRPRFPVSLLEAFGRRYRRNYAPIFFILALSWVGKVYAHPTPVQSAAEFMERSSIGPIPGWLVIATGIIFNGLLVAAGLFSVGLRQSTGEILPEPVQGIDGLTERMRRAAWEVLEIELPRLRRAEERKQLAYIVSDKVDTIGKSLMEELGRGVTLLHGKGMYTGKEQGVLMCALSTRQVGRLKHLVNQVDPKAFVIITPVQAVHGTGFRPIEA